MINHEEHTYIPRHSLSLGAASAGKIDGVYDVERKCERTRSIDAVGLRATIEERM